MTTMTYSAARAEFAKTIDGVVQNRIPVVIKKKKQAVVMMCLEDYEAWAETMHLLRSPANAKRLTNAIAGLDANKDVILKSFAELENV